MRVARAAALTLSAPAVLAELQRQLLAVFVVVVVVVVVLGGFF